MAMDEHPADVTLLLSGWKNGDALAFERLFPIVYGELQRLAAAYIRRERVDGAAEQMRPAHVSGPQGLALMRAHGSEAHITQTMTWVDAVAPGTHEISVRVRTLLGAASVGARTLTVSVFK